MTAPRISQDEVLPLPRWARLGLALRCVRRARGLIAPPDDQARLLDSVLDRLANAVHAGRAGDDLADAAASAYTLALDNLDARTTAPPAIDDDAVVVTCMVAHSAAFAAEAATLTDPRQAAHLVAQSIDFAIHAYRLTARADVPAAVAAMRADLERVRLRFARTDEAPLPADFFDGP
jgi:hypothetical protein